MTTPDDETDQAFPSIIPDLWIPGLTKREFFAGIAMMRLCRQITPHLAAKIALEYADALIEALKQEEDIND